MSKLVIAHLYIVIRKIYTYPSELIPIWTLLFPQNEIRLWNSLSNHVVGETDNIDTFKSYVSLVTR